MERSARVYRRSAEKLARFFRARKRMSDVIGAAFIFFFPYPSNPNWVTFSIRPSIDRSIDPRREIVCRIETAALRRFLCAVYLRAKRKAPAGNRVNKCWGLRVWIRIYAWGWLGVRAGNATSRRRIVHDQVERVTFFFRIRVLLDRFRWDEPNSGRRRKSVIRDFWGFWWVSTWEPLRDEMSVSTSFGILEELDDIVSMNFLDFFFLFMETNQWYINRLDVQIVEVSLI